MTQIIFDTLIGQPDSAKGLKASTAHWQEIPKIAVGARALAFTIWHGHNIARTSLSGV
jgi:hypothetical protein